MTYLSEADKITKGIESSVLMMETLNQLRKAANQLSLITIMVAVQAFYIVFAK